MLTSIQIVDLATNDAGQYSLAEYAVIALVPGFSPASAKALTWDTATLQGSVSEKGDPKAEVDQGEVKKDVKGVGKLRRWICMG